MTSLFLFLFPILLRTHFSIQIKEILYELCASPSPLNVDVIYGRSLSANTENQQNQSSQHLLICNIANNFRKHRAIRLDEYATMNYGFNNHTVLNTH